MRHDHRPPHQQQVVDADAGPVSPGVRALIRPNPELRAHFAALVEKEPDKIALFDPHNTAGDVGPVIKDKRNGNLGRLDGRLQQEKLLTQRLPLGSLSPERGLGQHPRHNAD